MEVCYVQSYFRFQLGRKFKNVAHPAKCDVRVTEGYSKTSFEFPIHNPFEWFINLGRISNSCLLDDHEHDSQYYPPFNEKTSPFMNAAVLQILLSAITALYSWLALQDACNISLLLFKTI